MKMFLVLSPKTLFNLSHWLPGLLHISKMAPESSKPSRTRNLHAKQKKDSLKNLKNPESLSQMKRKKQLKLPFPAVPKLPPVKPGEPAQAQGGREQQDESYEELMVDSLVSIATGLDGSLDEGSPDRLTIREVYDSISAGLKAKQNTLAPKVLTDLIMPKLYVQALLKEGPYRKGKIMASEQVAETFHKTSNGAWLTRRIRSMFLHYQVHKSLPVETRGGKRIGWSILDDESVFTACRIWLLDQEKGTVTPSTFAQGLNEELLPRLGSSPQRPIGVKTAYRWLTRLGFTLSAEQKGVYIDGHETGHHRLAHRHLPPRDGEARSALYEGVKGVWVATEPTLEPGEKRHVMYFHDESIFY
jgi:hypothetical protein